MKPRSLSLLTFAATAFLSYTASTHAATHTYSDVTSNTAGSPTQWSTAALWSTTPAVSDATTTLTFGASAGTVLPAGTTHFTNNDIASPPFKLNRLNFNYVGPASGPAPTFTIQGNQLELINNAATTPILSIIPLNLNSTAAVPALSINNDLLLTNNLTVNGIANLTLGGTITGTGTITKVFGGTLHITGNLNTSSLTTFNQGGLTLSGTNTGTGGFAIGGGTLKLDYSTHNTSKLADGVLLNLNGGTIDLSGGSHTEAVLSTTLNTGQSVIRRTSGSSVLAMGAITNSGGSVNYETDNLATTTNTGMIGVRHTVGGTQYAKNDGAGNIVAASSGDYTAWVNDGDMTAASYYSLDGSGTSVTAGTNSKGLKITTTGAGQSLAVASDATLTVGSFLFAGAHDYTISTAGTGSLVSLATINYGTSGATLSLGALGGNLNHFGTGKARLTAPATTNSTLNINGGSVEITNNLQIGTNTGVVTIGLNNGTLIANTTGGNIDLNNGDLALSRSISLNGVGGTIQVLGSGTLKLSGGLSGIGALRKTGPGTLFVDVSANTGFQNYSGGCSILEGTLLVPTFGNQGGNGGFGTLNATLLNGGTLKFIGTGATPSNRAFTIGPNSGTIDASGTGVAPNGVMTFSGAMQYTGSGARSITLRGTSVEANTASGVIGNAGNDIVSLNKLDAGQWVISGNNSFSGNTTVSGGTLSLGNVNAVKNSTLDTGAFDAGKQVNFTSGTATTYNLGGLQGADDLSAGIHSLSIGANNASTSFTGIIGGVALTKVGTGTLTLSGANTYTGATSISAGALTINSIANSGIDSAIGNAAAPGTLLNIGATTNTGTLNYTGPAATTDRKLAFPGTTGGATLNASGSGPVQFTDTGNITSGAGSKTLTLTGSNTGDNQIAGTIVDNNTGTGLITSVVKTGAGTWLLSAASPYTGGAVIHQGTLAISSMANLGGFSGVGTLSPTLNGGTLQYRGAGDTGNRTIHLGASGGTLDASGTGALVVSGGAFSGVSVSYPDTGARTLTLTGTNTDLNALSGSIGDTGAGAVSVNKTGPGTWLISGNNSYTGDTTVSGGTLGVTGNSIADTNKLVISGGKVDVTGNEIVDTLFFGATQKSPGVYGSTLSSAPLANQDDTRFSGTGTVTVNSGPAGGFATWITGTFANGTVPSGQQGPNADPDKDGISNLLEYAVAGLDPTVANGTIGTLSGKTLTVSKRQPLASDITYSIEQSATLALGSWVTVTPTLNDSTTISYTLPNGPTKDFMRLKITQP